MTSNDGYIIGAIFVAPMTFLGFLLTTENIRYIMNAG